jgi:hypothetical protein
MNEQDKKLSLRCLSDLVEEIKKRKSELHSTIAELGIFESNTIGLLREVDLYDDILSMLDTITIKEADLETEITLWANAIPEIRLDDVERLAKYFYELGLQTQKEE